MVSGWRKWKSKDQPQTHVGASISTGDKQSAGAQIKGLVVPTVTAVSSKCSLTSPVLEAGLTLVSHKPRFRYE